MATNPSDGDTTEGESSVQETTESPKTSSSDDKCLNPKKRKIDADSDDLSEEEDEEEEEKKEEDEDSCETDQAWGFDSFDDTDYESDQDDDDDFEWNRYLCHVYYSRGFKVDREIVPDRPFQGFRPFNFNGTFLPNVSSREYMDNMAKMALDKYNQHNETKMLFDHVVRVVVKLSTGVKSYITFMVKDSPQGDLIEFQAKTQWKVWQRNAHAILCRQTPTMKPIPPRYLPNPKKISDDAAIEIDVAKSQETK